MEYVESLERAHRKDGRASNIYVEHPHHRSFPAVGSTLLLPSPDPVTARKANRCSPGDNSRVFTTPLAIRHLPEDDALKAFVRSSPSHSATDFRCVQAISYQKPSQDRETLRHGLPLRTERLLSPPDCCPSSVHCHHTCCSAAAHKDYPHHRPILVTGFPKPSADSLPSRSDGKPIGGRTPSRDQQRHDEVLDASGVMRVKHERTIVNEEEDDDDDEVCPRCGKRKRAETDEQGVEGGAGYGPSRVVDAVSCLCCVKAVFYHCCSEEDDDTHLSDAPCSCTGRPLCCPRWTCLVLAGITCLPCLALYWPCRLMLRLVARCRNLCAGSGCACAKAKEGYDACAFRKF